MGLKNLKILGVMGIGPGAERKYEAKIGGELLRIICENGPNGILGLGLLALPSDCEIIQPFSATMMPNPDYGSLSDTEDNTEFTVWITDSAGTDSNPCPTFASWCTANGGTYEHSAS